MVHRRMDGEAARYRYERDELLAIGRALSSERDIKTLLGLILSKSRQITAADAGSVYVVEPVEADPDTPQGAARARRLRFMLSQNDSITVDFHEFTLPIDGSSIVGRAALDRSPINVADLESPEPEALVAAGAPPRFRHNRSFDLRTGYRARSMLTVPMLSAQGEVIGVIQLINCKRARTHRLLQPQDFDAEVLPFDDRAVELALALASQAGVCLENAILYDEIRNAFEGFVDAAVTAIESRDPTTSGHSRRVATLAVGLAEKIDGMTSGPFSALRFSPDDLRQLEYAGVLHDFGKVGVRESVLVKAKKLYENEREVIRLRLGYVRKALEAETLARKLDVVVRVGADAAQPAIAALDRELAERAGEIEALWRAVLEANEPTLLAQPARARLDELGRRTYMDSSGEVRPYLDDRELEALQIPRGSLTDVERQEIQSHVTHTIAFLETIPWGRTLRDVPRIAGAHHESLDGRCYPLGLRGEQIPVEARMLTIADIFDALTASDRPYKSAVPVPRALDILASEVKAGKCDPDLFDVFVGAEIWRRVV